MKRCAFLGSKSLGLRLLRSVEEMGGAEWRIFHPVDDDDARSVRGDFTTFARERSIDILSMDNPAAAKSALADFRPDFALVCGWYWLLDAETLSSADYYGIHNSLLPRNRGGAPLVWSIINDDEYVGSSVFKMTPGMDEGDILFQVSIRNDPSSDVGGMLRQIEEKLELGLPRVWRSLVGGTITASPQDHSAATYCGQRTPSDGAIDWSWSASRINNFIRAQTIPYPGAFSFIGNRKLTIWQSSVDDRLWSGTPGQVLERGADYVLVACGSGAIRLLRVSIDGMPVSVRDALRSVSIRMPS